MQNAHRAGWNGVFFEYRDGEHLQTSAAYAARKGLFVQSVHAPFEDIWRLWEDAGEGGEQELNHQIACIRATAGIGWTWSLSTQSSEWIGIPRPRSAWNGSGNW